MRIREKVKLIIEWFEINMPDVETELNYNNNYELLVAVILSAQCTDKRVNIVTPNFFLRFPTPFDLATASVDEIFSKIRSISYPNAKAKNLKLMAEILVAEHQGEVPSNFDDLIKLAGVGRKTANVMQIVAFDIPAMPVDTHVFRVANRLGLTTNSKSPEETEKKLLAIIPKKLLGKAHHWFILHGRYICKAKSPLCNECGLTQYCTYYNKR